MLPERAYEKKGENWDL